MGFQHEKLIRAIQAVQRYTHRDISINYMIILLHIFDHEGTDMYELEKVTGMALAALSRSTKELTKYIVKDPSTGEKIMKGYNLLSAERDLENTKKLVFRLTSEGKKLKQEIESIFK